MYYCKESSIEMIGERSGMVENFDEQALELLNTMANDIFEIRRILTAKPDLLRSKHEQQ